MDELEREINEIVDQEDILFEKDPQKVKEYKEIIYDAYYPKITRNQQGKFSNNEKEEEVLKEIVNDMKQELLLFNLVVKVDSLNPFQQEIFTKFMKRAIN